MSQQGTLTVLNRQTSFGTFGGGDAASCIILAHICCTSGAPNCDKSTGDGSGGKSGPPGSTTDPGGNATPGGSGSPGGGGGPGGAGKSVAWSARRTDPDATVVSRVPSGPASESASISMAAAAARRRARPWAGLLEKCTG